MLLKNQIYISDLDGTLLQGDAQLSSYARRTIAELLNQDFPFTIATARSVTSTKEILGDLPLRLPVICANGGAIYHYDTLKPIKIEYLPSPILIDLLNVVVGKGSTAFVSAIVDEKERVYFDSLPNGGMQWYYEDRLEAKDKRMTSIESIADCQKMNITTITFMDHLHRIKALRKFFTKRYGSKIRLNFFENKYSLGWYWLSIHAPGSNKGHAIDLLLSAIGWESHHVTVFGDEWNDIPMFERADKAIAVRNGLPSVKAAADEVIERNTDDAVVNYLLKQASKMGLK
jgi:Cof subfamily protein (haloacid dehalogenase superfamily)